MTQQSAPAPEQSPTSQPAAPATVAVEGKPKGPNIRIGSQRYGATPPPAVPRPVLGVPPLARSSVSDPGSDESTPPTHEPSPPRDEPSLEPATHDDAALSAPDPADVGANARDSQRHGAERAGKKPRGSKPRSQTPKYDELPTQKIPPPNIRGQLSPELELEYLEALGGAALDDILAGEATNAAPELEIESRHAGKVVSIHRDNVFVEIAGRQQGVVPLKYFAIPPEPGAVIDVMVSRFDPAEGLYELAPPGTAVDVGDWSEVAEGMVVEAHVTGHNKGGLECEVNRLRGFIPASQVTLYRVEDLAQFVDQRFTCVVSEVNPEKRNLVLSRRAMLEREKADAKQNLLASLEVGQTREGTVRSLQPFGAFVDLGGVDGLIHISQLSWDRIKHADEVLQLGQQVKVRIQKIDPQTGKIGLAFRDLSENPWANVARDFPTRSKVTGTVSRIMEFGAFVRLAPGVEGLIHVSELSHKRVWRATDLLAEGQEVEVLVLSVDAEQQRIGLSLKSLEARPMPAEKDKAEEEAVEAAPASAKKRTQPLKGGIGGPASGERFGLKW